MNPRTERNGEFELPVPELRARVRQNGVGKLVAVVDAEFPSEDQQPMQPLTAEAKLDAKLNAFFGRSATLTSVDGAPKPPAAEAPIRGRDLVLAA